MARVEIDVATALAVSWKPFVKSNASAVATTMTRMMSLSGQGEAAQEFLMTMPSSDVGHVLGRVDRFLEALEDVLPADDDHRVDAVVEQRGEGLRVTRSPSFSSRWISTV